MPSGFYIGSLNIRFYGVLIALGMLAAYWLTVRVGRKFKLTSSQVESVFVWTVVGGIVGARVYHVVDYFAYYRHYPLESLMIWQGGLGIYGAIIGGWLGLAVGARRNKINLLALMNSAAPGLILAQAIGRLGNWANMEGFGGPTSLPWGLYVPPTLRPGRWMMDEYFHPTFIYEALLCLVGFGILWWLWQRGKPQYLAGGYLVIYGFIRLFTERFRLDTASWGSLAVADVFSVVAIVLGIWVMRRYNK